MWSQLIAPLNRCSTKAKLDIGIASNIERCIRQVEEIAAVTHCQVARRDRLQQLDYRPNLRAHR